MNIFESKKQSSGASIQFFKHPASPRSTWWLPGPMGTAGCTTIHDDHWLQQAHRLQPSIKFCKFQRRQRAVGSLGVGAIQGKNLYQLSSVSPLRCFFDSLPRMLESTFYFLSASGTVHLMRSAIFVYGIHLFRSRSCEVVEKKRTLGACWNKPWQNKVFIHTDSATPHLFAVSHHQGKHSGVLERGSSKESLRESLKNPYSIP